MVQYGTGGFEAVSDVIFPERAYEHFVDGRKNNLSKSLFGAVVLVEEGDGSDESIANFGDLGASGVGWDNAYRSGVYWHKKSSDV